MANQNKYDMLQFHITDGRDWLKFAWSEYFKWYAAFLTLNLVALAYYIDHATGAYRKILGYMFSIINPLSIALALIVYLWSRRVHANIKTQYLEITLLTPDSCFNKNDVFPHLAITFATAAICFTQFCFFVIWVWELV